MKKVKQREFENLTDQDAQNGIKMCLDSARAHLEASRILTAAKCIPGGTFMAYAALEEIGKAHQLITFRENTRSNPTEAAKNFAETFMNHGKKLEAAVNPKVWMDRYFTLISKIVQHAKDKSIFGLYKEFMYQINEFNPLDTNSSSESFVKQRSRMLYTDWIEGRFVAPTSAATEGTARQAYDIADKALAIATFDCVFAQICLRRGATRAQFAEMIKGSLPEILKEVENTLDKGDFTDDANTHNS